MSIKLKELLSCCRSNVYIMTGPVPALIISPSDNLLDAAAIYFTRFERYIVHHILLSNHVLTRHVVFLLYWSRYGGNEVENG
ncbi:MAG: hypothetical protein ACLR7W_15475 [Ruminococcus sp.]